MADTLATALPHRMKEIREVYIPAYREIGPAGTFAIAMMQAALTDAERALGSGDVLDILRAYQRLMDFEL